MKISRRLGALACILLIVFTLYACGSSSSKESSSESIKTFEWPTSGMAALLPKPSSNEGSIYEGSSFFDADIENIIQTDYQDYVSACKEKGFTIDAEEKNNDYTAFNSDGYKVSVHYYDSLEKYDIRLKAPMYEVSSTFEWPSIGLALLIPEPESHFGEIREDSTDEFDVYVGETPLEEYNKYVNACIDAGFSVNYDKSDKLFEAFNEDGVYLSLQYEGFNTFKISMLSREYASDFYGAPSPVEEMEPSTDAPEEPSASAEAETPLAEPSASEGTSEEPGITENTPTEAASEPDILTAENCQEFADVLSCGDFSNQLYADFYEKYQGKTVEFDGCIVLVEDDQYNGYYDVMICPGNYSDAAFGPQFMFDGAAPSAFEEGRTDMDLPSYVKVGANVRVVATLSRYNDTAGLCYLNPKSVTER